MDALEIQKIKDRCKYGCIGLYTPMTVLQIIEFFERKLDEASEAKKVKLPRDVAEALEEAKEKTDSRLGIEYIAWRIARDPSDITYWEKLHNFADKDGNFFLLIDALRHGYTIKEPQTFQTNRKLEDSEITAIRRWYMGAMLREQDGTDPDGFAREAIGEVALYLGGAELLKDMSSFCRNQLEREKAQQSG